MTTRADTVTDGEVAEPQVDLRRKEAGRHGAAPGLRQFPGSPPSGAGLPIEAGGPLPPLEVRFAKEREAAARPRTGQTGGRHAPPVPTTSTTRNGAPSISTTSRRACRPSVERRPDPGSTWEEVPEGPPGRIPAAQEPDADPVEPGLHGLSARAGRGLVGLHPAFGEEAKQDRVFEESLFWVVTRTIHCFY